MRYVLTELLGGNRLSANRTLAPSLRKYPGGAAFRFSALRSLSPGSIPPRGEKNDSEPQRGPAPTKIPPNSSKQHDISIPKNTIIFLVPPGSALRSLLAPPRPGLLSPRSVPQSCAGRPWQMITHVHEQRRSFLEAPASFGVLAFPPLI